MALYRAPAIDYQNPGHYRSGIFDLQYRNARPYRTEAQYRLGIDDPIGDTGTGVDAQSLLAALTPADTGSGVEGTYPSITVTLEGGGPVLEWVTGITETHLLSVGSTDTGSGADTEISGVAASDSDAIHWWYGSQQGYRSDVVYQAAKQYRGAGSFIQVAHAQVDTGAGVDTNLIVQNGVTVTEALVYLETHGIYLSQADTGAGVEVSIGGVGLNVEETLVYLEALGDRVFSAEELMDLAEGGGIPIGTVAGPLSLRLDLRYRTNRAGRFPGRMRSRR